MTKYRLKKDTPEFKAGTVFDMIGNIDVGEVLTMNSPREDAYAFEVDSIDNFDEWFEEVKESGWWKPRLDEMYYFLDGYGKACVQPWLNDGLDDIRYSMGNVFKTKEAAERYGKYLKAVTTVRQDEGVIDLQRAFDRRESVSSDDFHIYTIAYSFYLKRLAIVGAANFMSANTIWFDTEEHADASCKEHQDEWKIIANYDWSRE